MRPNNLFTTKVDRGSFLRTWLELLTPYHKLTSREKDVAARILSQYLRLKEKIEEPAVLTEVLWSHTSRKDMMSSLGMSRAQFQGILASLKTAGFLLPNNEIESRYIPHVSPEDKRFMALFVIDWSTPATNG